ncbi:MAG: MTAP family purine nucleoside phosphorylase [Magnetococcales bacterium]|nr:MTAP family purine nucleoside phosphorylase [Magnetococcales bacterium]
MSSSPASGTVVRNAASTPPRTALIGGTSLLESPCFRHAGRQKVVTAYGEVELVVRGELIFLQRHGLESYTPPHRIDHRAHIAALHAAGVKRILAVGSVGSLRPEIAPGSVLFPDDFYAPHLAISFFEDARGHRTPGFDRPWREQLLTVWRQQGLPTPPVDGGVYWQTIGPRFETPAEVRAHQPMAHLVGMTLAAECILAGEMEIPYAALCMVDNYANGITDAPLTYAAFKEQVRANEERLVKNVDALLTALA